MTLLEYYLKYLGEIAEQKKPAPTGIVLTQTEESARAMELQSQVAEMGPETFVRACAAQDGVEIPQSVFDSFDPGEITELLARLNVETEADPDQPEKAFSSRNAYEVLLDCCCLEDGLMGYLLELLKTGDEKGFWRLAQVTTRTDMRMGDFLFWLATLHQRVDEEQRACAVLMDACFERLIREGQKELMAGLLAGDRAIFEAFRCEAPELQQVPAATFEWFERNYLDSYFPFRAIIRANDVTIPQIQ